VLTILSGVSCKRVYQTHNEYRQVEIITASLCVGRAGPRHITVAIGQWGRTSMHA